jgi:tetratricopeptide (TPR) repeat protein
MEYLPELLIAVVLAGLVLWQLATGCALDRNWRPSIFRDDSPGRYWFTVLSEGALLLFVLVTCETSSRFQGNRTQQGRADPQQKVAAAPSLADERRTQAFDLHRAKKFAEAKAVYDELLRESGQDAELTYWRAMASWNLGHTDQALQDFRRTIELNPANFEACRNADRILSQQQRWDEILEIWDRYIRLAPTNAQAHFERGGTNYRKGNLAAAQADAATACELGISEACAWAERLKTKP